LFCGGSFPREAGEVETMTKAELVEDVARAAELTKKDAERLVEIVFESIIDTLNQGEKIELRGFGSFRVRERGARRGRNPKTGDPVDIPAKRVPYFKPGKELKELINEDENGAGEGAEARTAEPPDPDARPTDPPQPDVRAEGPAEPTAAENNEQGGGQTPPLM
jgi:integration host factor subunit beta